MEVDKLPQIPDGELSCGLDAHIIKKSTPAKWVLKNGKVEVTCQPFQNLQALPSEQGVHILEINICLKLPMMAGI